MATKKKLGIIGGMGSHASSWLLERITQLSKSDNDQDYLEIILHNNSRIPDRTKAIIYGESSALPELKRSLEIFNENDIDISVMACMTSYYYYNQLVSSFSGKLLHPVDLVVLELYHSEKFKNKMKIGLIGSTGLLNSGMFQERLKPLGFDIITLDADSQEKYFMYPIYRKEGIKAGVFSEENKELFLEQINILKSKGAEIIVGACSEIPLILDKYGIKTDNMSLPFIDTFNLLAQKVVEYCYHN